MRSLSSVLLAVSIFSAYYNMTNSQIAKFIAKSYYFIANN